MGRDYVIHGCLHMRAGLGHDCVHGDGEMITLDLGVATASHVCAANPYEYVNKESSCTFHHSLFSEHCFVFVRFQVLLFVYIVENTLYLLYTFSGVHLGTPPLESRRQV